MRVIDEMSDSVKRMQYPLPAADGSMPLPGTAPPLIIKFNIDPSVILPEKVETVGFWDEDAEGWGTKDDIFDVEFDAEPRTLPFSTTRLGSLALLQPTTLELLYKQWIF